MEGTKGDFVAAPLPRGDEFVECGVTGAEAAEGSHDFDERAGLQKHQSAGAVVIRECPKGLVAQRDVAVECEWAREIERALDERHVLVDAAEAVDGHFFDEQFFDLAQLVGLTQRRSLRAHGHLLGFDHSAPNRRANASVRLGAWLNTLPVPVAAGEPVLTGTGIRLDAHVVFADRDLVAGGAPWRLLRLRGRSLDIARRWRDGDVVRPGEEHFARTLVNQGVAHLAFPPTLDLDNIDAIIPAFNDLIWLDRLLESLRGLHVTVVDDASTDEAAVAACVRRHGATLVRHTRNEGPATARNDGAAATARELLWFVDTDVTIEDATHVASQLAGHFRDPLVAAVAPRVQGTPGPRWRDHFEARSGALDMGPRSALVVPLSAVGYVPSACLMVRRTAFGDGFDEALRVGEDVDFVWRLHDSGWLVRYDADVVVTHAARATWPGWWRQREGYGRSTAPLALRHGVRLALFQTDALTLATWTALLAGRIGAAASLHRVVHRHARDTYFSDADDPTPHDDADRLAQRGPHWAHRSRAPSVGHSARPLSSLSPLDGSVSRPSSSSRRERPTGGVTSDREPRTSCSVWSTIRRTRWAWRRARSSGRRCAHSRRESLVLPCRGDQCNARWARVASSARRADSWRPRWRDAPVSASMPPPASESR